jgi:hypothetical protein
MMPAREEYWVLTLWAPNHQALKSLNEGDYSLKVVVKKESFPNDQAMKEFTDDPTATRDKCFDAFWTSSGRLYHQGWYFSIYSYQMGLPTHLMPGAVIEKWRKVIEDNEGEQDKDFWTQWHEGKSWIREVPWATEYLYECIRKWHILTELATFEHPGNNLYNAV